MAEDGRPSLVERKTEQRIPKSSLLSKQETKKKFKTSWLFYLKNYRFILYFRSRESQNHVDWRGRTSRGQVQPPAQSRSLTILSCQIRASPRMSIPKPLWRISSPSQKKKKLFLISNCFPLFSSCVCCFLPLHTSERSPTLSSLYTPIR